MQRTDGETGSGGHPAVRSLRDDAAVAAMQGLLANPNTHGTGTEMGPIVTGTAVWLADLLIAELAKERP